MNFLLVDDVAVTFLCNWAFQQLINGISLYLYFDVGKLSERPSEI